MQYKSQVPDDRPAFHVDDKLREAAKKAARAFREEEEELRRSGYGDL